MKTMTMVTTKVVWKNREVSRLQLEQGMYVSDYHVCSSLPHTMTTLGTCTRAAFESKLRLVDSVYLLIPIRWYVAAGYIAQPGIP